MQHPMVLLLPLLMLADYYLTVYGALLYPRGYGQHVKLPQYELNPVWQKDIRSLKWLNGRHLLLVALISGFAIWIGETTDDPNGLSFLTALFGALLMVYILMVGRHLSNILLFRYVARNPGALSGEIQFSHKLSLKVSLYQTVTLLLPMSVIAYAERTPFTYGALAGVVMLVLVHQIWIQRYESRAAARQRASQPENAAHVLAKD